MHSKTDTSTDLPSLFLIFLKTGSMSYGGWTTTVVLLQKELTRRKLQANLDTAVSYGQILPGATQVAIVSNVGYQLLGSKGAVTAVIGYLIPSVTLMTVFAALYYQYAQGSDLFSQLQGLIAALSGIILANAYRIGSRHTERKILWIFVGLAFLGLIVLQVGALALLILYGASGLLLSLYLNRKDRHVR